MSFRLTVRHVRDFIVNRARDLDVYDAELVSKLVSDVEGQLWLSVQALRRAAPDGAGPVVARYEPQEFITADIPAPGFSARERAAEEDEPAVIPRHLQDSFDALERSLRNHQSRVTTDIKFEGEGADRLNKLAECRPSMSPWDRSALYIGNWTAMDEEKDEVEGNA